jgi:heme-degrading monooxygenase HmoA
MIKRLVKMTFQPDKIELFKNAFEERRHLIAGFEGCSGVMLIQDVADARIFFTISTWNGEQSLEHYRTSELFQSTWALVKPWFEAKAEAWSTKAI